jgi:Leucine-rich repeat (LRR) protein
MRPAFLFTMLVALVGCASSTPNSPSANQAIERAIRSEIGKSKGELTAADLAKVTKLPALTEKKISNLTRLKDLPSLRLLRLSFNEINDLGPLKELEQLIVLELDSNQITDVSALKGLKQLRRLNLAWNPDLTKAQIQQLQNALPNCSIIHNAAR